MKLVISKENYRCHKTLIVLLVVVVLTMMSSTVFAAVPERVKTSLSQGTTNPSTTSKITVSWSGWATGDHFYRSLDGVTWTELIPGAGGFTVTSGNASYVEDNFTNWNLVYFKISNGSVSKRINVFPPIESGHANYSDNTNQCKVCHITHTAQSARLLSSASVKQLCYTCHGVGGTGSRYNVEKGLVLYSATFDWGTKQYTGSPVPAYRRSSSGPFAATSSNPQWNNIDTTSSHDINNENTPLNAPGGGGSRNLSCISCHNAHASNENYRLLNTSAMPGSVEAYARINSSATLDTDFREQITYYNNGMNRFCSICHGNFNKQADSGHTTSDSVYRHATEVDLTWTTPNGAVTYTTSLPKYIDKTDADTEKMFCLTCHYAHGSTAQGLSPSVNNPSGSTVLKRVDNMGVCEECHKK